MEGLSEALHVSVEWLKGETDEYETDITDKRELQIRDAMGDILEQLPLALTKEEDAFSKDLLLLMLKQYGLFLDSFQFACKNFKGNAGQTDIAKTIGFESNEEYNEIMFLREITPTINALNEMADVVRLYSKKPKNSRTKGLQIFVYHNSGCLTIPIRNLRIRLLIKDLQAFVLLFLVSWNRALQRLPSH